MSDTKKLKTRKKVISNTTTVTNENINVSEQDIIVNDPAKIDLKKYGKRTPLHKQKKVGIKPREGWTRRGVVCKPGRIEEFVEAGWTPVEGDQIDTDGRIQDTKGMGGSKNMPVVNYGPDAVARHMLWMEIPTVIFEQDQKDKEDLLRVQEEKFKPRHLEEDPNVSSGFKFEN